MKITVFTAPDCPKCRMTLTRFSLAGVDVNEIRWWTTQISFA